MSLVTIHSNHVSYFGSQFFVGNAPSIRIGSYGKKATPLFGMNKLEVKDDLPQPKLKNRRVKVTTPMYLDSSQTSSKEFSDALSASIKVVGINGTETATYSDAKSQKIKFVQIFVNEEDMKAAINASPKARNNLASYGGDARVVHSILVAMNAEFSEEFVSGYNHELDVNAAGILSVEFESKVAATGTQTLTLGAGTTLAYLLLDLKWNKDKTRVDSTSTDEWSVN